jgi:hypothetical protein
VSVEKGQFPPKEPKFEGYKMSRKLRKLFVGHPGAILFLRISREGVFQQTRLITTVAQGYSRGSDRSGRLGSSRRLAEQKFQGLSKDFPDVVCQKNDHAANATNPEEKVGRQLGRIDLLFVHRRGLIPAKGTRSLDAFRAPS